MNNYDCFRYNSKIFRKLLLWRIKNITIAFCRLLSVISRKYGLLKLISITIFIKKLLKNMIFRWSPASIQADQVLSYRCKKVGRHADISNIWVIQSCSQYERTSVLFSFEIFTNYAVTSISRYCV